MLKPFTLTVFVIVTMTGMCLGQETVPPRKFAPLSTVNPRAALKLEINYNPGLAKAYVYVGGPETKPTWIWLTRFATIPGWQLPSGALPIRAVRLEPQFNGETTEVRVTLLRGQRSEAEQEELVGKFHLEVGESRTLSQLQSFGIEPFIITITNFAAPLPSRPIFDIRLSAVEIASVELENLPVPSYKIKFRNLTTRSINALKVDVNNGASVFYQGEEGKPLIEPSGVHEEYLDDVRTLQRGGSLPEASKEVNTILISSAVFADGTYDGAPGPACVFAAMTLGRRTWLKLALPLFDSQIVETEANADSAPVQFKEKVLALNLADSAVEKRKPGLVVNECPPRQVIVDSAAQAQRQTLLRELDRIITTRPKPPIDFKSWLQATRDRYAAWLSRLETTALK